MRPRRAPRALPRLGVTTGLGVAISRVALAGVVLAALGLAGCGDPAPVGPGGRSPVCETEGHDTDSHGAPHGVELLKAIAEAEHETVFSGYRTTTFGGEGSRTTRMRIARYPSGQTVLDWDEGGERPKSWVYETRYRWLESPELLASNYAIAFECGETPAVAFRDTCRVRVRSRRPGRPSLELLVDAETWLILRETWRDHAGEIRRVSTFDTLEYGVPGDAAAPSAAESLSAPRCGDDGAAELAAPPLAVGYVPDGFVRVGRRVTRSGALREYWSDGLAAFSLLQQPADAGGAGPEGEVSRRSCDVGTRFSGTLLGRSVTIVGSLPPDELERVLRGLRAATQ